MNDTLMSHGFFCVEQKNHSTVLDEQLPLLLFLVSLPVLHLHLPDLLHLAPSSPKKGCFVTYFSLGNGIAVLGLKRQLCAASHCIVFMFFLSLTNTVTRLKGHFNHTYFCQLSADMWISGEKTSVFGKTDISLYVLSSNYVLF